MPYNCTLSDVRKSASRDFGIALGESGGILTQSLRESYHLFSNMHESRINIGYFNDLAFFNCLSYFSRLGPISRLNRHQRHQGCHYLKSKYYERPGISTRLS